MRIVLYVVGGLIAWLGLGMIIGWYLSPQDELKPAGAIVSISGGDTKSRVEEAVKLYKEGWSTQLIFSGAAADPQSPSNAEAMRDIAREAGVPAGAIWLDELSRTTEGNADNVAEIVNSQKHSRIILVTSPYHQRRASIEFSKRLGDDIEIINHSAYDKDWRKRSWWTNPKGWWLTWSELPKVIFTSLF